MKFEHSKIDRIVHDYMKIYCPVSRWKKTLWKSVYRPMW